MELVFDDTLTGSKQTALADVGAERRGSSSMSIKYLALTN